MRQQIQLWGTRILVVVMLFFAGRVWGVRLYEKYFTAKKQSVYMPTGQVQEGKFTVSFHEIGTLDAENSVAVNAQINGKVITIVPEGKIVSAGEEIALLDTTELEREVYTETLEYKNRLADVDRANAEMDLLKESNKTDLEGVQAQLEFDQNELKLAREDLLKKQRLELQKLIPGTQVDQAEGTVRSKELAVAKGEAALSLKKKEVESKETQKKADISNVEFIAKMAKSKLDRSEGDMKDAVITAPAPGLVVLSKVWDGGNGHRALKEGDMVNPRQTICMLPDLTNMLVTVQVGESDAPKISVGLPVIIRLEAVPKKVFHGTVKGISSLATEGNPWDGGTPGKKNFEVKIAVQEHDPSTLKPGMTADVEFICSTINSSVYVPIESVVEHAGKTYVFVKEGSRYVRTPVTTGKSNDNYICITKGLTKGQVLALRDPTRDLDQQESGSLAPGADKKKQAAPIPDAGNK